jgi:hypothetical protein
VGGWRSSPPALRALARGGALRLLCCRSFEQRLQLQAHSSLLEGRGLRAAAQQHGHSGKVLRRLPEKWRSVSFGVHVNVRTSIGASVVVGLWPTCRGVGARPCGWSAAGRRSRRLPFPSRGNPCTGTSYAGCRSRGSASTLSSWHRRASSSSSWRLVSASSSSHACRWASALRWRGAGSGSELLDEEVTQTLHPRVGSWRRVVRAPPESSQTPRRCRS